MSYQETEQKTIKDFQMKIEVMKKGIIDERKKSKEYLKKIESLEGILNNNLKEIEKNTKEKFKLKSELNAENHIKKSKKNFGFKDIFTRIFKKDEYSQEKMDDLINEYKSIIEKNKGLEVKIQEQRELLDIDKVRFQTKISVSAKKLSELTEEYNKVFESLKAITYQRNYTDNFFVNFSKESKLREEEMQKLEIEKNSLKKKLESAKKEKEEIEKENNKKGLNLNEMVNIISKLSYQIGEKEREIQYQKDQEQLMTNFKAKKFNDAKIISLIFFFNKSNKKIELQFNDSKKEFVKLSHIEKCEKSTKGENCIDLTFNDVFNFIIFLVKRSFKELYTRVQ